MKSPLIIDLSKTGSQTSWNFAADQDVIFVGSTTTRTLDRIYVTGGHNVAIIGGKYEPTGGSSATIHINGVTGNVYIDGVHIDHKNSVSKDGIGVAGASGSRPNVYIQNTIIDNITGTQNGVHGDMFQRYGQLGDVKMYNVSGSTDYQGLFLNPAPGYEIRSVELENIDIVKLPGGDARTWTYYFYSPGDNAAYPVSLKNVYSSDGNVFPPPGYQEGAVISGDQITFPNKAFSGHMTLGRPTGGDFVKAGDIGIGYTQDDASPSPAPGGATSGADVLPASATAAVLDGGTGYDRVDYSAAPSAVTVDLTAGTGTRGWAQGDVLRSIEGVIGTKFADKLVGDHKANDFVGNKGGDDLDGLSGNDSLSGGTGHDHLSGGGGADVIIGSSGNDVINGGAGNDRLSGGSGGDRISGGSGGDVLSGGTGNDLLSGGGGNDQFVFSRGDGDDVIVDFQAGAASKDQVVLKGSDFHNFAEVKAAMSQVGQDTVINLGHGDSVKLLDCSVLSFTADDFSLV